MSAAHTPGPWHSYAAPIADTHIGPVVGSYGGDRIAAVIYRGDTEQSNANARLIAAAPELLEALRHLVSDALIHGMETSGYVDKARAALAKAVQS